MSQLKVLSTPQMGPLEVSVYGPKDETFEFVLSSGATQQSLTVNPGRYAVVARRPSGARLRQSVEVDDAGATVHLSDLVGGSPNEFMHHETMRGNVTRDRAAPAAAPWRSRLGGVSETLLRGAITETVKRISPASFSEPAGIAAGVAFDLLWTQSRPGKWTLRLWSLGDKGWEKAPAATVIPSGEVDISSEFLKVTAVPQGKPLALGLIDDEGLGPIVNLPPFARPVEISFLSRSLTAGATDRAHSPGGQRVPVAVICLANSAAQDLLAALAEPTTPSAEQLWSQSSDRLSEHPGPWKMLIEKFQRPAEALLAAHYLLRFLPGRLPVDWADNLCRALPTAMDGPVIAAWARLHNPPAGLSAKQLDVAFKNNIELALKRQVTLFARTRALLFEGLRLIKDPGPLIERTREAEYRRYGAEAGGLESFWGGHPTQPGTPHKTPGGTVLAKVSIEGGAFNALQAGPGRTLPLQTMIA